MELAYLVAGLGEVARDLLVDLVDVLVLVGRAFVDRHGCKRAGLIQGHGRRAMTCSAAGAERAGLSNLSAEVAPARKKNSGKVEPHPSPSAHR